MLKIKDFIDIDYLRQKYDFRLAHHVDEPGTYLFYTDYFYIDVVTRKIHIEKAGYKEINMLYDLIQADLVEKV